MARVKTRGKCSKCGCEFCAACGEPHPAKEPVFEGLCGDIRWDPARDVCIPCQQPRQVGDESEDES